MIPHVSLLLCIVYRVSAFRFVPAPAMLGCFSHFIFAHRETKAEEGNGWLSLSKCWRAGRVQGLAAHLKLLPVSAFCLANQTLTASVLLAFLCAHCTLTAARFPFIDGEVDPPLF